MNPKLTIPALPVLALFLGPCLPAFCQPVIDFTELSCGRTGAGELDPGDQLQRHDMDLRTYPGAMCNDGSPGIFYFRPYVGEENRNRWVIQLKGGGVCDSPQSCADRWCAEGTNFGMNTMSSITSPRVGIDGHGILNRNQASLNPWAKYNHVFIHYCSSDQWMGNNRNEIMTVIDPGTHVPRKIRAHFLGHQIFEAAIDILRARRDPPLTHFLSGQAVSLPDLDDAEFVVLAGGSAGGLGVSNLLDYLESNLRRNQPHCRGAKDGKKSKDKNSECGTAVIGLSDSAFPLSTQTLLHNQTDECAALGLCTWEALQKHIWENVNKRLYKAAGDESCVDWHRKSMPGTDWQCADTQHVQLNHITTPIFFRMGQTDQLISRWWIDAGYGVPGYGPLNLTAFAAGVQSQVQSLAMVPTTGHEGAAIAKTPGGFSPTCEAHEVLDGDFAVFGVRITQGGASYRMFDAITNWLTGVEPSIVVAPLPSANTCTSSP